jgi:hypothetical protein
MNVITMTVIGLMIIVLGFYNGPPLPYYSFIGALAWLVAFFRVLGPSKA